MTVKMFPPASTSTRHVLNALDVNSNSQPSSLKEPPNMLVNHATSTPQHLALVKQSRASDDSPLGSTKRDHKMAISRHDEQGLWYNSDRITPSKEQEQGESRRKRFKIYTMDSVQAAPAFGGLESQDLEISSHVRSDRPPTELHGGRVEIRSSPASTCVSSAAGMDESQDTVLTIPDEGQDDSMVRAPIQDPNATSTRGEMRLKASQMKLRLSLASYKVRTNQIDVPMSRLQIRSTSPQLPRLARLKPNKSGLAVTPPKQRTPLPEAASSSSPIIAFPTKRAKEERRSNVDQEERLEALTPIVPRQREGIRNPPKLGSPVWADLMSSVVKGCAADGLLSLSQLR